MLEHDKLYVDPVEPDIPIVIGACSLLGLISGWVARVILGEESVMAGVSACVHGGSGHE